MKKKEKVKERKIRKIKCSKRNIPSVLPAALSTNENGDQNSYCSKMYDP